MPPPARPADSGHHAAKAAAWVRPPWAYETIYEFDGIKPRPGVSVNGTLHIGFDNRDWWDVERIDCIRFDADERETAVEDMRRGDPLFHEIIATIRTVRPHAIDDAICDALNDIHNNHEYLNRRD